MPARRFNMDSNKSPSTLDNVVTPAKIKNAKSAIPLGKKYYPTKKATMLDVKSPPIKPSMLLLGDTLGASFLLPNFRPTK